MCLFLIDNHFNLFLMGNNTRPVFKGCSFYFFQSHFFIMKSLITSTQLIISDCCFFTAQYCNWLQNKALMPNTKWWITNLRIYKVKILKTTLYIMKRRQDTRMSFSLIKKNVFFRVHLFEKACLHAKSFSCMILLLRT